MSKYAILLACAVVLSACNQPPTPKHDAMGAYQSCKTFVRSALKSPSTADFPLYDAQFVTETGSRYTVRAYVDAQNSFGAMLRTSFMCELSSGTKAQAYNLIDLRVGE